MDIILTATGTPGNVAQNIAQQLKTQAGDQQINDPTGVETWPTLAAVRDSIAKYTQGCADDDTVTVDVAIKINVTAEPAQIPEPTPPATPAV